MRQDASEARFADLPFANVFVAIQMRTESAFGIVRVHHFDKVEPEDAVGGLDRFLQTRCLRDVEAGGEEVARVETIRNRQIGFAGGKIADHAQFLETLADLVATADGVFEQHCQARRAESRGRFSEAQRKRGQALFERLVFVVAGMQDEVVGADGFGAVEFTTKRRDRFRADFRIELPSLS